MNDKRLNPLNNVSTQALFKELKRRQGVDCLVIDEDYVLKINKKEVDI